MHSEIQTNVEGIIPNIQQFSLEALKLSVEITQKEQELANIPEAIRLKEEISLLKKTMLEKQTSENALREQGKKMMLDSGMKDFTTLNGTTVSLQFSPGSLVVSEGANIPDEFYKIKTSKDLDKTSLKKAITDGTFSDDKVFIQKDCKFIIKSK